MFGKRCGLIIFFLFLTVSLYSSEKWNIVVAGFNDLSDTPQNYSAIIQRSIAIQLQKNPDFKVFLLTNQQQLSDYRDVILQGRSNRADVVVSGDYYVADYVVQGDEIVVTVELTDVLDKKVKLRKVYTGVINRDIFDTVDSMAVDLKEAASQVLPPLSGESETRVKKQRRVVYEEKEIDLKRAFQLKLGTFTDIGTKSYYSSESSGTSNLYQTNTGSFPITMPCAGFMVRYWDIRLDMTFSGAFSIPAYDWKNGGILFDTSYPGYMEMALSYYLPWLGNQFGVGIGFIQLDILRYVSSDPTYGTMYERADSGGMPVTLHFFWNPVSWLELRLSASIPLGSSYSNSWTESSNAVEYTVSEVFTLTETIPALEAGVTAFIGDWGIEGRFTLRSGAWSKVRSNDSYPSGGDFFNLAFYLGAVYKIDFFLER